MLTGNRPTRENPHLDVELGRRPDDFKTLGTGWGFDLGGMAEPLKVLKCAGRTELLSESKKTQGDKPKDVGMEIPLPSVIISVFVAVAIFSSFQMAHVGHLPMTETSSRGSFGVLGFFHGPVLEQGYSLDLKSEVPSGRA